MYTNPNYYQPFVLTVCHFAALEMLQRWFRMAMTSEENRRINSYTQIPFAVMHIYICIFWYIVEQKTLKNLLINNYMAIFVAPVWNESFKMTQDIHYAQNRLAKPFCHKIIAATNKSICQLHNGIACGSGWQIIDFLLTKVNTIRSSPAGSPTSNCISCKPLNY